MTHDALPPCGDDLKTLLSRHVDGELPPEERLRVEEHVATCAGCRDLLTLFQRNENLIASSLATEKFGGELIESVMAEIRRDGLSAEASPVEEGAWEWLRARPLISSAAAALLAAGLVGLIGLSQSSRFGDLKRQLAEARSGIDELALAQQDQARIASARADDYERLIRSMRAEEALRLAPERWMLAYVEPTQPHLLVVRASFDAQQFRSFDVYRRGEREPADAFRRLNGDRRLSKAEFTDSAAAPGQGYVYKFRAYRGSAEADFLESMPIALRLPLGLRLSPEKAVRVRCDEVARNLKMAVFTLEREIGGRTLTERFHVEVGRRIGDVRDVPGAGRIDFRTELVLERLEEGNQTLAVSYTEPLLGPDGRPVLKRIEGGTFVPETAQRDEVLSVRSNLRCQLRPASGAEGLVDLWKGGWILVRAAE